MDESIAEDEEAGRLRRRVPCARGAPIENRFDWLVAETSLSTNGRHPHYEPEEAHALVMRADHKGVCIQMPER
ncbi:hypothetical protein ABZY09_39585 [Streptomyces sp. NPDC002928]|uniref:hypothetical protein n=1 Tax=Streptomyces sp. NPDC002928 TaxID=3154440 RepID=UPI0033A52ACB